MTCSSTTLEIFIPYRAPKEQLMGRNSRRALSTVHFRWYLQWQPANWSSSLTYLPLRPLIRPYYSCEESALTGELAYASGTWLRLGRTCEVSSHSPSRSECYLPPEPNAAQPSKDSSGLPSELEGEGLYLDARSLVACLSLQICRLERGSQPYYYFQPIASCQESANWYCSTP